MPNSHHLSRSRGGAYGALLLTAALWGSSGVTARGLLDHVPPVALAYLRWIVVLVAAMLLFGHAVARVGAVRGGIFTHLVPVFTALFAAAFLGERLQPCHAAGFALVAGGAILCCLRPEPMLSSRAPRGR